MEIPKLSNLNILVDDKTNHQLFLLLIVLNIIDFITTYVGITFFGSTEMNPIMANAIQLTGTVWAIFGVKALVFTHIYYHYYHTEKGKLLWLKPRTSWFLGLFNIMFLVVVINNIIRIGMKI